jgi:hypothetical protein
MVKRLQLTANTMEQLLAVGTQALANVKHADPVGRLYWDKMPALTKAKVILGLAKARQ